MSIIDSTNSDGFDESMGGFVVTSKIFSINYYHGLPSKPPLLATTQPQRYISPIGFFDHPVSKTTHAISEKHPIASTGGGVPFIDLFGVRDPLREEKDPFTATLSFPISAKETLDTVGSAGFFLDGGGEDNNIYLVTARHVALVESFEES
ncbi:hypothetical protein TWF106_010218 [Orbilia oligospora]|uniref:Uncharacterized protein n=1 Tax=Orbilia oligospora TaxID=2813651 RepID=A0A7C8QH80_ORBOL|nr:hypothetical protein TWF106_010218 [Orbilia oligospora]